jgi:hypothetical protein
MDIATFLMTLTLSTEALALMPMDARSLYTEMPEAITAAYVVAALVVVQHLAHTLSTASFCCARRHLYGFFRRISRRNERILQKLQLRFIRLRHNKARLCTGT